LFIFVIVLKFGPKYTPNDDCPHEKIGVEEAAAEGADIPLAKARRSNGLEPEDRKVAKSKMQIRR
jgi:hypothetical protein